MYFDQFHFAIEWLIIKWNNWDFSQKLIESRGVI
jgi:hypothetical protein